MPAPLSIIIPTLNAASDLPECLQALMPGLELGLIREVIVSDGGSDDATPRIAGDTGATGITVAARNSPPAPTLHAATGCSFCMPTRISRPTGLNAPPTIWSAALNRPRLSH